MLEADGTETALDLPLPPCLEMALPGNWHYSGMRDFFGRVRFTRRFVAMPQAGRRAFLCLDGVDYACQVCLNGHLAGQHEGCFRDFEFDVTPWLNSGGRQEPYSPPINPVPKTQKRLRALVPQRH